MDCMVCCTYCYSKHLLRNEFTFQATTIFSFFKYECAAPQFTLTDITGHPISLSNYRGKVVILDFWASWCPPCRREIPDFISLQKQYASQGLQIIGIGLDQPNNVAAFVQQYGINYPVAVGDDAISNLYGGVSGIPTTFIIDKEGNISNKFEGFTDRTVFEQEIKKLL
jgi:peroxiredoxin